ncbi:MAG: RNA methyltransferase [Kiritimatiellae bacterium]|nr:RNA methyltransferase [Kiritimatiellia bacterium]
MHDPVANPLLLTSPSNPRIKQIAKLRQRSHRDAAGALLVEGYRELKRAIDNGWKPQTLVSCPEIWLGKHETALVERCVAAGAAHFRVVPSVFAKISARDRPDGLLAVGPQLRFALKDLSLPPDALVVVAESIEKPGNLGTILRSADAAGAAAVIVCDRCTDVQNPNVVRASVGTLFSLPVVETSTAEALEFLCSRNFRILASTPHAEAFYTDYDLTGRTAVVVGAEQVGLRDAWFDSPACTAVRIPMLGQCDSLNVASATTILLYEVVRQRVARDRSIVPPPALHEHGGDDPHGDGQHEAVARMDSARLHRNV